VKFLFAAILLAMTVLPAHAEQRQEYVRVTFYTLRGCMADSGQQCDYTEKDAAACSQWIPFGTQLMFNDGYVVTCRDRGRGDWYWKGWVDVWAPSWQWGQDNIHSAYGDYTWVTVIRWGWDE
jgi:hypothetical protein